MTQTSEDELAVPQEDVVVDVSNDVDKKDGAQTINGGEEVENIDSSVQGKVAKATEDRGEWASQTEYILSCLGYVVGLGNIWRFPYICYINGGGAFLIPYLLMVVFLGLPMFLLEVTIGQYSSFGSIMVWEASPLFKGVGITIVLAGLLGGMYYNMIIGYAFYYMFASFQPQLPWQNCGHDYNTKYCYTRTEAEACESHNGTWANQQCYNSENSTSLYATLYDTVCNGTTTDGVSCWNNTVNDLKSHIEDIVAHRQGPSEEYFNRGMLDRSDRIEDAGYLKWDICLIYLLVWLICFFCIVKGIKSVGKVVYVTAIFPYVILTILFWRGITLPGAIDGIKYYILPDWEKLQSPKVWADAACQAFFSLSIGGGGLITYSSYNRFKNNMYRDMVIVTLGDCLTSFFAGFVIFSVLGYMANEQGVPVPDVVKSGSGLMFIAYPEIVTHLPYPNFWAAAFFLMVILLGIDTAFANFESFMTGVLDAVPSLRNRRKLLAFGYCMIMFVLGLSMCTRAGIYWVELMNYYSGGWSVMLVALIESLVFSWVYGADRLLDNMKEMLGVRPCFFWKICWKFVTPVIISGILVFTLASFEPLTYGDYALPDWAQAVGWLMASVPVAIMITFATYRLGVTYTKADYTSMRLWQRVVKLTSATSKWGPQIEKTPDEDLKTPGDDISEGEGIDEGSERKATAISFENPAFEETTTDEIFGSLKFL